MTLPVVELAPAKVNLFLAIGPRRRDGYHELLTLFEPLPLYDEVSVAVKPQAAGPWTVEAWADAQAVPRDLENLAGRAARLYEETLAAREASLQAGSKPRSASVRIVIRKRVPVAAGLGGGSSDAAAVLRALQAHFGSPLDSGEIHRIAANLGSDVPFFVEGARAVGSSRGELLEPLPAAPGLPLVVGLPSFQLATAAVYAAYDRFGPGSLPPDRGAAWPGREDRDQLDRLVAALAAGDFETAARLLRNDLQPAVQAVRPETGLAADALRRAGCLGAAVSGSGPAVFGLASCPAEARAAAARAGAELPPELRAGYAFVPLVSGPAPGRAAAWEGRHRGGPPPGRPATGEGRRLGGPGIERPPAKPALG